MRRKVIVILTLVVMLSVPAYASTRMSAYNNVSINLSFDNEDAKCKIDAFCSSNIESITAKVRLYYVNSDGGLNLSKAWLTETVSGNSYRFLEYAYDRVPGRTYVLEAVLTATDSDGVQETITLTDEDEC